MSLNWISGLIDWFSKDNSFQNLLPITDSYDVQMVEGKMLLAVMNKTAIENVYFQREATRKTRRSPDFDSPNRDIYEKVQRL